MPELVVKGQDELQIQDDNEHIDMLMCKHCESKEVNQERFS